MNEYDVVIIGAGPAGEKAGAQAAYFGHRVAIVEKEAVVGGAMVNTGTLPSKTLRETALFLNGFRQRNLYGINLTVADDITVDKFMYRQRQVVQNEVNLILDNIKRHHIDLIYGSGSVTDPHTVKVVKRDGGEERLTARFILIATGSYPFRPKDIPFDNQSIYDSDSILHLNDMPESITIIGGGVIGCEYASVFAALGIRVNLVDGQNRLLPFIDAEIATQLQNHMERNGVKFCFNDKYTKVETDETGKVHTTLASGVELVTDKFLFAAGRSGTSRNLGLDTLGISISSRGQIAVNENYQTSVPNIYAAGDVIGFPALASTSMEQGRLAMCHALNLTYKKRLATILPYGLYTIPEISMAGMTEEEVKNMGIDYEVGRSFFSQNARGQIIGELDGMIKLIFSASNQLIPVDKRVPGAKDLQGDQQLLVQQQLLGVHIIGEMAAELIQIGLSCMYYHGTIDYFIQSVFNFPTLSEAFKYAAYDGMGRLSSRQVSKPL